MYKTEVCKRYLMSWTSNNGRKDSPWRIISGKASFAHSGAVVNDEGGRVFVTHLRDLPEVGPIRDFRGEYE